MPAVADCQELARALGNVSAAYLLCVDDDLDHLNQRERALISNFRAADERGRDTISRIAETQPVYGAPDDRQRVTGEKLRRR